jgi:hypothetical protein
VNTYFLFAFAWKARRLADCLSKFTTANFMANAYVASALTDMSSRLLRLSVTRNMNVLLPQLPRCINSLTCISGDINNVSHAKENGAFTGQFHRNRALAEFNQPRTQHVVNVQE